jgi:putative oxidoreductase
MSDGQASGFGKVSSAIWAIRFMVSAVFFLEGIKKFIFAEQWGAGRFTRIGIPAPHVMGPFVGGVEIICGLLVLLGLQTSLSAIPLLGVICPAIATTKVPILFQSGFWPMEAEARTDYAMLMGLIFLVLAGSGCLSLDAHFAWDKKKTNG